MSYSPTLASIRDNSTRVNEPTVATSPKEIIYNSILRDFVYKEVSKALKKRSKDDGSCFDIDSKEILKTAIRLADAEFRRSLI